jgi:DNA-binding HxlR family transcriptional regulator
VPTKSDPARSECPIANALDLLGDRWTLLVLRDLIFYGRHEFGEFLNGGEGIATNVLSDRLERLCCAGIVARFHHPTNGKKYVYRVTATGIDLIPTMIELVIWSERHLPAVRVPPERMAPLVKDRANFIRQLRRTLLAELNAAGKPLPARNR